MKKMAVLTKKIYLAVFVVTVVATLKSILMLEA